MFCKSDVLKRLASPYLRKSGGTATMGDLEGVALDISCQFVVRWNPASWGTTIDECWTAALFIVSNYTE